MSFINLPYFLSIRLLCFSWTYPVLRNNCFFPEKMLAFCYLFLCAFLVLFNNKEKKFLERAIHFGGLCSIFLWRILGREWSILDNHNHLNALAASSWGILEIFITLPTPSKTSSAAWPASSPYFFPTTLLVPLLMPLPTSYTASTTPS